MASRVNVAWVAIGTLILLAWAGGSDWTGNRGAVTMFALGGLVLGVVIVWAIGLYRRREVHWGAGFTVILTSGVLVPVILADVASGLLLELPGSIGYRIGANLLPGVSIALVYYGFRAPRREPAAGDPQP